MATPAVSDRVSGLTDRIKKCDLELDHANKSVSFYPIGIKLTVPLKAKQEQTFTLTGVATQS